ncbi:iron-containing alcohol dehydrogenase family protein [Petroclostridium sp. X23]|uniref:iron-containing alcohol dehydrogenase family protein n=1 Tax=Petroclostridium sp. X23 TaxID=3045146 RepID=UPI0024ADDD22|nr:iron-containing alcohol dehydrogenase family protein [Petroclostridium sp. X23]WHH58053.1 iron-containing alcohol dehydrogenase family protein [Petroclostridium sp. X23]
MKNIDPNVDYLLTAPTQYISRNNVLDGCGRFILKWGKRVLVSSGARALKAVENKLFAALDEAGIKWEINHFSGECCDENISIVTEKVQKMNFDAIIGVGGGKSLDTAKRAAEICGVPIVCIPTIAATCAAASVLSVIYTQEGVHKKDHYLERNPNLVLVDPQIIANAPVEYLESGILDSISKWYEGNAAFGGIRNPDIFASSAVRLALLLNELMEKHAIDAVQAVKNNQAADSVVIVADLNIYLAAVIQSIGKKTRGAVAHGLHAGLSIIPESHDVLHGFKIGYGIIVQLIMEKTPIEEIKRIVNFFRQLDLEPSFKGLKLPFAPRVIQEVAEKSILSDPMQNMPFKVTAEDVVLAMEKAEAMIEKL